MVAYDTDCYTNNVKWNVTSTSSFANVNTYYYVLDDYSTGTITGTGGSGGSGNFVRMSPSYTLARQGFAEAMKKIGPGKRELELPDGAKLCIDDLGNYRIEDKDAKVQYKANRVREFSPHLNASDLLAKFVDYLRTLGIKQHQVLQLPVELFVNWLVIEAAERDQDPIPDGVERIERRPEVRRLLPGPAKPKCLQCGRFIPAVHQQRQFLYCGDAHAQLHLRRPLPQLSHSPGPL